MTENPINPAALYDYAASKNDMDSLRPEERTFLEACAWEWERLIDHGAEEWGKQFEALGIKPGVPQAPSAKPTPAAPEKPASLRVCVECGYFSCACPAPSSPAAERADEGLEEEAERLREAYTNDEGSWLEWPDCRQEPWLRVARAARALRRGGVTEEPWGIVDDLALSGKVTDTMTAGQPARSRLRNELSAAVRERDQLAAKLAEAERALCERAEQVDKLMQERDLVMARLGNFCQPGEIEDRIRILQGHAGKMERQRDEARADAERLRGERDEARKEIQSTYRGVQQMMEAALGRTLGRSDKLVQPDFPSLAAKLAALRTAPPAVAVNVTDSEKLVRLVGEKVDAWLEPNDTQHVMKRKCADAIRQSFQEASRAASVEEVAQAIMDAWEGRPGFDVRYMKPGEVRREQVFGMAHAALRALGVREAEKNATPFVVDRESVAQAIDAAWVAQPFNTYHAADAAIAEIERQRAEHAAKGGAS